MNENPHCKRFACKVGDLVSVDYDPTEEYGWKWLGICTWTDGYKYSFLVSELMNDEGEGDMITWNTHDLMATGAKVLG